MTLPSNFRPMLSGAIREATDFDSLYFPSDRIAYFGSPKLDGIRTLIHPHLGAVTRTLKPIRNRRLWEYFDSLARAVPEVKGLDGELTAGSEEFVTDPTVYNMTVREVMSGSGGELQHCTYWLFDKFYSTNIPNLHELNYDDRFILRNKDLIEGIEAFEKRYENPPAHCLNLSCVPLTEKSRLMDLENLYINQGFEGLMLRDPTKPYKFGRSAITRTQQHLIKVKRFEDAEGTIIGFQELMHNQNEAEKDAFGLTERSSAMGSLVPGGTLGALSIRITTGDFAGGEVEVGTGFDQALRQQIWDSQAEYLNKTITFKYQAIGSKDAPRFPVFKGFRDPSDIGGPK